MELTMITTKTLLLSPSTLRTIGTLIQVPGGEVQFSDGSGRETITSDADAWVDRRFGDVIRVPLALAWLGHNGLFNIVKYSIEPDGKEWVVRGYDNGVLCSFFNAAEAIIAVLEIIEEDIKYPQYKN